MAKQGFIKLNETMFTVPRTVWAFDSLRNMTVHGTKEYVIPTLYDLEHLLKQVSFFCRQDLPNEEHLLLLEWKKKIEDEIDFMHLYAHTVNLVLQKVKADVQVIQSLKERIRRQSIVIKVMSGLLITCSIIIFYLLCLTH